jgi:hypothetical protein
MAPGVMNLKKHKKRTEGRTGRKERKEGREGTKERRKWNE